MIWFIGNKMFTSAVITLLAVFSHGAVLPPVPMSDGKIAGGTTASIEEAPYQVALMFGSRHVCGGSIINKSVILTAAQCVRLTVPSSWTIRAGSTYYDRYGQLVEISRFLIHSGFNNRMDNNIALMYLSSQLILGTTVATAKLPSQGQTVADESPAFVTGWGRTIDGGSSDFELRKVTIPIVNQALCVETYANINPVTDNMICAGNYPNGFQGACMEDSGGPLTVQGVLIGITSWGNGCARPAYPGVWTRVPMYVDWIKNNA